jgi:ABC-2 type transport system permease protein
MKSRFIGSLAMPFFFLIILGIAPISLPNTSGEAQINLLVPGIIGMILLFGSMGAGTGVLWDKEFGFLKEIMVAPIKRRSIVLGKATGGVTTALTQGIVMLILGLPFGLKLTGIYPQFSPVGFIIGFLLSIVFMSLIGFTFIGLGIAFASRMKDFQGFQIIWNFTVFPILIFSNAFFPLSGLPHWLRNVAYFNPLTYGVDGLRGCLVDAAELPLLLDLAALLVSSAVMIYIGAHLFNKTEVD